MRPYLLFVALLWFLFACTLTANQEKSLNRAIIQYQNAYNKELTILEVSLTHPCVIDAHLSDTGSLKKLFIHSGASLENYDIQDIEKDGADMKVKLTFDYLKGQTEIQDSKKTIYALSSNRGESWFFLSASHMKYLNCKRFNNK
ncbi:MAG: hypothetical protein RL365_764 [Bacteroidota bacterium]|jgi:hypothetical protein